MALSHTTITVGAVCCRNNRFLLIEEVVREQLVVTQPSGHWESRETLIEAVVRETMEESGHHFTPHSIGGVYFWQHPTSARPMMRVNFIGSVRPPQQPVALDEGIERYVWRNRAEILAHPTPLRTELVLRTVDDYLCGKRYPLDILQHIEHDLRDRYASAA